VEYVEAGCDGFVLNLDHGRPGLDERVLEFAEQVAAPLRQTIPDQNDHSDSPEAGAASVR
jgi:hypothetical protein